MKQIDIEDINNGCLEITEEIELFRNGESIGKLIPNEAINTVHVKDIINQQTRYFIPAYQRGYRWDEKQVKDLLSDIWNHGQAQSSLENAEKSKYCLQPIVLKKSENQASDYDLVDGQQRLTALFILLKALGKTPSYTLNYERTVIA